jgi:hypothetical protein
MDFLKFLNSKTLLGVKMLEKVKCSYDRKVLASFFSNVWDL